ncbi:MAG: DUF433 domain-containing protein [Chloroflexi bacterium]|nr:DUF433 domain-containing protein [Chloroflexota bacterium]
MDTSTTPNIIVRTSRGLTIADTRITLYTIIEYLKNKWPPHLIQDWLNLTDQQIQGALEYIETHPEEVEAEYRQVLADAAEIRQYWEERNRERFAKIASLPPPPGKELAWAKLQEKKATLAQE